MSVRILYSTHSQQFYKLIINFVLSFVRDKYQKSETKFNLLLFFRFVKLKIIVVSLITVFLRIALNAVIYTTDAARTVW